MPSILSNFEYDIFISYRHNDNRSGWVTEFVKALQEELAATIKEPVSVYFDSNPHYGLLETHNVDKSLEGKLKCLIFIPILSQTYCDPKSFAWQHEFIAFNALSSGDQLGRDIKLKTGNVASRILPVQIHELEDEDKELIEKELGSVLRSVDFIYQSAGVVRPLLANEVDPKINLKHTYYRDQVNKVVRGIKELISGMQSQGKVAGQPSARRSHAPVLASTRRRISVAASMVILLGIVGYALFYFGGVGRNFFREHAKSIAVLPFKNLNNDPEQEYLTQGITEDILNHLTSIADLKVKASYASFNYKESTKPISEIGGELGVASILTGSIQRNEKTVRIIARLIDVETGDQLWSHSYDREMTDILKVQSEIALEIADVLKATLSKKEFSSIKSSLLQNAEAYEYYLKARNKFSPANSLPELELNRHLLNKAIKLDPRLADAYALKGWSWYHSKSYGFSEKIWLDSSSFFADRSIELNPQNPSGYLLKHRLKQYGNNFNDLSDLEKAYELAPNNTDILFLLGNDYLLIGKKEGADLLMKYIDLRFAVHNADYYRFWSFIYSGMHDYGKAEQYLQKVNEIDNSGNMSLAYATGYQGNHRKSISYARIAEKKAKANNNLDALGSALTQLAESYSQIGNIDSAEFYFHEFQKIEKTFPDTTQFIAYRHRLGYCLWVRGDKAGALALFNQQMELDSSLIMGERGVGAWGDLRSAYYDLGIVHAFLNQDDEAMECFEEVYKRDVENWLLWYFENDLLLKEFRKKPKFAEFMKKLDEVKQFRIEALKDAVNRHEAANQLKSYSTR